jgi:hypothetical protein
MSKYSEKETAKRSGIKQTTSRRQLIRKKTASAKKKPEPSSLKHSMKIFDDLKINTDHQDECIKAMVERAGTADRKVWLRRFSIHLGNISGYIQTIEQNSR